MHMHKPLSSRKKPPSRGKKELFGFERPANDEAAQEKMRESHGGPRGPFGCGGDSEFIAHARKIFDTYDSEGGGRLSRQEAKLAWMALLGCKPSRCELANLLAPAAARTDSDEEQQPDEKAGAGRVGWSQFAHAAARRRAGTDGSDEVRRAFKAFDRRCAGFLTLTDVKQVFSTRMMLVDLICRVCHTCHQPCCMPWCWLCC